jgi:3'-phosphoadenosine 5'-phosphosulfate sulfotransferase (PAPS reductase)/FAD synthetase
MNKVVGISGGKDSTAMALRLQEVERDNYRFAITPTGRELPPVLDHWKRLEDLLGSPLIKVPAPTIVQLIVKFKALPNWRMRWCTRLVKIEPFMDQARCIYSTHRLVMVIGASAASVE